MWLIGTYKDIHNNTITVKIRNEKNGDNIEIGGALVKFAAEDAVTIDCDRDDYFTHIIKKSATIRLVTRIYLGDYLWAANQKSVIVNILRNNKCVFAGYVTPNTYTQDYVEEWTTLDVNCRDLLSTLEDTNLVDKDKYDAFKQNAQTISLKDYLTLFGILKANLNLDNYPQPAFMSHFIWITDGYIYQDGVFYAKLIEVEQVTIDGQVKNIATGNYRRGKVLEPNWILDETKTTTYNGLKYNLEFAYLDIDGDGIYETRTNASRRTAEPVFDQVYRDTVTYGDVIEQIHLEEYTVTTNVTRTYVVDYGIHKAGDVVYLHGMEHCPFELRDDPNMSALKRYVWVYYGNEWHKTNFYEDIGIPDKPIDPNPDLPDPKPDPDPDQPTPEPSKEYLCFTSTGNSTITLKQNGIPNTSAGKVIQYKLNDGQWQTWDLSKVTLTDKDKMYVKSDDEIPVTESYDIYKNFVITGSIAASGNIMSLLNFSTTLSDCAFYYLFNECTVLTSAPELPAITLSASCYFSMFGNCSSLVHAPELPATTLASRCYSNMFNGCTSLTHAPSILPATTLAIWCYSSMFNGCTALTTAPELPAAELVEYCYFNMFCNCSKLNYVKALFTTYPIPEQFNKWLYGVSVRGTFIKSKDATWDNSDVYMPAGWTVKFDDDVTPSPYEDYLCFTSTGNSTISMTQKGKPTTSKNKVLQYKINNGQWQTWDMSAVTLTDKDKMYVKSDDTIPMSESNSIYKNFVINGSVAASGNIMSLLNFSNTLTQYAFYDLFYNCISLTTMPELPATTLAPYCYCGMFQKCWALTFVPELPATTLVEGCYMYMFTSCTKLIYVKAMFTDISARDCLYSWLYNILTTGTFVKSKDATWANEDVAIPEKWTVQTE